MKLIENKSGAADAVTHEVEPYEVNTNANAYTRAGWLIILLGLGTFLLWAFFAPLDKGVPLSGTVAKETNRKAVQHPTGGIVEDIFVKDGDTVKAGQLLVRMNSVQARSQAQIASGQYISARMMEARLMAEAAGTSTFAVPAVLADRKTDPQVAANLALQNQLLTSRQMALRSELAAVDENIAGIKIQIHTLEESRDSKKLQLGLLKEQLGNMRDLAREGYVPRNRQIDLERTYAQLSADFSQDVGNIARAQRQVMELSLRRSQRMQEQQKEIQTQLADTRKEANGLAARLQALEFEVANAEVKAPVDGAVVGLSVFTRGGVVSPGFKMMDIVPTNDALVVDGQLAVNLIDKVHVGLPVELMFSAFNANKTPHIPGVITAVSADRTIEERSGMPYYKITARVTPEGQRMIAAHKMDVQSGMPVELFVKTGERTMMNYLLKPIIDRSKSALSED